MPKSRLITIAVILLLLAGGAIWFLYSTYGIPGCSSHETKTAPSVEEGSSVTIPSGLSELPLESVTKSTKPSLDHPVYWENLDNLPRLIYQVRPEYPESMREQMVKADVRVRLTVDEEGNVARVEVVDSPDSAFYEPALAAARQYKFEPQTLNGEPVPFAVETTVVFDPKR